MLPAYIPDPPLVEEKHIVRRSLKEEAEGKETRQGCARPLYTRKMYKDNVEQRGVTGVRDGETFRPLFGLDATPSHIFVKGLATR